jgi:hypothetical protein
MPSELTQEKEKVNVTFGIHIKNVPEENVQDLKLEINYCLLQLAKKHSPEDILVNLYWY